MSWDNLALLVFMHEALPLIRKIGALKIVQEDVGVFEVVVDLELSYETLSHSMKSKVHHPFVPMYYSLVLLKTHFLA